MDIAYSLFDCAHDNRPREITESWLNLCARLARHEIGDKDGPALACATFAPGSTRASANVVMRALVALDIEINRATGEIPPALDVVIAGLTRRRQAAAVWTTHSHTAALPRYRVVMALSHPVAYDAAIDPHIAACAACELGLQGVSDASKYNAASLFYLPRHRDGAPYHAQAIAGEAVATGYLITAARTKAEGVAELAAVVAARRAARALAPAIVAAIAGYNDSHPLPAQLARYEYRRDGGRWKSRYQSAASQGATTIVNGGATWISFSESDAAAGVGARPSRTSQAACYGDAFALCRHYEYNGDFFAALAAIREE